MGIFSRNSADFVFAYMGATSLGAIAVPINFQLSNREIAYIIKDSGIRTMLTYQPLNLVDALAALRCDLKVTQYDIKTMSKADPKIGEAPALRADFDEHKPCATIYTSGTTGNPKGAVLSHRNLVANCEQMRDNGMGCKAEHNVLCVLPMYHAFGWTCSVLYSFFCGAEVVILDSFTPKETIAVIREEKVTDLYIVPSICSLLTKLASTEDMKTLRLVVSGGTTLPLQIQQDFIKKFLLVLNFILRNIFLCEYCKIQNFLNLRLNQQKGRFRLVEEPVIQEIFYIIFRKVLFFYPCSMGINKHIG